MTHLHLLLYDFSLRPICVTFFFKAPVIATLSISLCFLKMILLLTSFQFYANTAVGRQMCDQQNEK